VDQGEASLNQGDLGHSARARPGEAGHQKAKIEHTRGRTSSRTEEAEAAGKGVCGGIEQHEVATWGENTRNEKLSFTWRQMSIHIHVRKYIVRGEMSSERVQLSGSDLSTAASLARGGQSRLSSEWEVEVAADGAGVGPW
jgi:hypothetical protein